MECRGVNPRISKIYSFSTIKYATKPKGDAATLESTKEMA